MQIRKFTREELDFAYLNLNNQQREVLNMHVKRGKQTKWLNSLARAKGAALRPEDLADPESAMKKILDWVLVEYVDAGQRTPELRCMCGQSLRYRYSVLNMTNGKIVHFSRDHLSHHLGMPLKLVRDVVAGFAEIDLERDEILGRVLSNWTINFSLAGLLIPKDMVKQFEVNLPLLARQERRLRVLFDEKVAQDRRLAVQEVKRRPAEQYRPPTFEPMNKARVKPQHRSVPPSAPTGPRYDPLHEEVLQQLLELAITGKINSTAAERLFDGMLHFKRGRTNYMSVSLEECVDAARAALAQVTDEVIRKPLLAIVQLLN